jgi:hypothetical protein
VLSKDINNWKQYAFWISTSSVWEFLLSGQTFDSSIAIMRQYKRNYKVYGRPGTVAIVARFVGIAALFGNHGDVWRPMPNDSYVWDPFWVGLVFQTLLEARDNRTDPRWKGRAGRRNSCCCFQQFWHPRNWQILLVVVSIFQRRLVSPYRIMDVVIAVVVDVLWNCSFIVRSRWRDERGTQAKIMRYQQDRFTPL